MRGCCHSSDAAIRFAKHHFNISSDEFPKSNLHERACNPAAHFVEEAVATNRKDDLRPAPADLAMGYRSHGGFLLVPWIGRKRLKIVAPDEQLRG